MVREKVMRQMEKMEEVRRLEWKETDKRAGRWGQGSKQMRGK